MSFSAGLAGNLVAGWIQQNIWSNFFSSERVIGTITGAGIMLVILAFLENGNTLYLKKNRKTRPQITQLAIKQNSNLLQNNISFLQEKYDVFISHANEDKEDFARPLANALQKMGFQVWYDEFELDIGDSLRQSTDKGLINSRYGVVVLSKAFLAKQWPQYELNGLFSKEVEGEKVILPVWHNIERKDILEYSPILADKYALNSRNMTVEHIAEKLSEVFYKQATMLPNNLNAADGCK